MYIIVWLGHFREEGMYHAVIHSHAGTHIPSDIYWLECLLDS